MLFGNFHAPSCYCVVQQAAPTFCGCFPQQIKSQKAGVNFTCSNINIISKVPGATHPDRVLTGNAVKNSTLNMLLIKCH